MEDRKKALIKAYIKHYNNFDVEKMLALLDEHVVFENEANGQLNVRTEGKAEFREIASKAVVLFKTREQTIKSLAIVGSDAIADIDYSAVFAVDIPNGPRAGTPLTLCGKTLFSFKGDKISAIKDISRY